MGEKCIVGLRIRGMAEHRKEWTRPGKPAEIRTLAVSALSKGQGRDVDGMLGR